MYNHRSSHRSSHRSNHHQPPPPGRTGGLVDDPVYYLMLGVFVLLTVALPAVLGQPRFMPLSQSAALTAFLAVALRARRVDRALISLGAWLLFEFVFIFALTLILPRSAEAAVGSGFAYREALLAWLYGVGALPAGWATQPLLRLWEVAAVTLGSLLSGGFLGYWILVKVTALAAYGAAALWESGAGVAGFLPWMLLRVAGYSGFVLVFAQPLWAGVWSPAALWREHRRLLLVCAALLAAALLIELALAGVWRAALAQ